MSAIKEDLINNIRESHSIIDKVADSAIHSIIKTLYEETKLGSDIIYCSFYTEYKVHHRVASKVIRYIESLGLQVVKSSYDSDQDCMYLLISIYKMNIFKRIFYCIFY